MGLLDLYENARVVATEYNEHQRSVIDDEFAADLARSYDKSFEEEHSRRLCELDADLELARELAANDEIECQKWDEDSLRQSKEDEEFARRLQSEYEVPASPARQPSDNDLASPARPSPAVEEEEPSGFERTVEICKRAGSARVGLELEKVRRDVVISAVRPGLPADEAKLQAGDMLLAVNGVSVSSATKASQLIAAAKGSVLLTTRHLPGAFQLYLDKPTHDTPLGLDVAWDSRARELRIMGVDGLAEEAGTFEVGDTLVAIGGTRLDKAPSSATRARELLRGAPAGMVGLRVVRAERAIAESLGLVSPGRPPREAWAM